jgi:TolB-like protein/DNA-binding winged helix-turn-helix (wHTH) protein/Tfp pilus assembly protein PilF
VANDFRVGEWLVQPSLNSISRNGSSVRLEPKVMEVLVCLASRPGETVPKDELLRTVWPDTFVTDDGPVRSISELRRVFQDDAREPRVIQTIPKRGYRLVASVEPAAAAQTGIPDSPQGAATESPGRREGGRSRRFPLVIAAMVLVALGLAIGSGRIWRWLRADRNPPPIHSLAVLPLQNLSGDPAQEYFSDGMTEALITDLAQIGSLKVISRTSTMQYKNTKKSVPQIARELNVDGVIEGTVQRSGDRVRITAQLIDAVRDQHLWAESYESKLPDVLGLQDKVASAIAREIQVRVLGKGDSRRLNTTVVNEEAYDLYLRGRYFWNKRDAQDLEQALDYFQKAAAKDPGYAPAPAGLADTYSLLGSAGYDVLPRAEAMEKARAAAQKALAIDGNLAEAHASLAYVIYSYDWDWAGAEKEFKEAIALNPNYPTAHQWYSEMLNDVERKDEALAQAQTALALDPLSLNALQNLARVYYFARRFDEAIQFSQSALEMDPNFALAHLRLGRTYTAKEMFTDAVQEFRRFSALSKDKSLSIASIGNALARSGDRPGAMRSLGELSLLSQHEHVPAICFALAYAGLQDNDQALASLEKAYNERSDFLLVLKVDPLFDGLREDPRFQELVRRIRFPVV